MAITLADFNKIWASTSPLTPYSFSEANYKQGWNFIGSTPPARQMWDYLQKNNDEKMQYLANNYLPLTGGTMTGSVQIAKNSFNTAFEVKNTAYYRDVAPSGNITGYPLRILDNNGNRCGGVYTFYGTNGAVEIRLAAYDSVSSTERMVMLQNSGTPLFYPSVDNTINLGGSSLRWKQLYAGTATINTSDERVKNNIEPIPDEVLDAWGEVGWYQFQFKDSVAEKGENARIHTGTIAQRIKEVFEKHNLDAFRYGLLCYDEWDAVEEQKDEDGNVVQEAREAGNRYSLRYEEALCMEAAYQRRRADRLEERIARLEALMRTE